MKKNLKLKFFGPLLIVSLFIFALACEEESVMDAPSSEAPATTMNDMKDKEEDHDHSEDEEHHHDEDIAYSLISDGELTVCTDAPYEPFEFQDEDGTWTGFDMDIMRILAGNMDVELTVKVVPFDGIWLLPAAGECDVVASAMTITEERAASTLFTDPYFDADQSLLVRTTDAEKYSTLASLSDSRIAVQTGTTGEMYAEENKPSGATLVSFDEPAAMFLALQSGEVDAILQDLPVNGDRQKNNPFFTMTETFPTGESY